MHDIKNVETTSKTATPFENARRCGAKAKSTGQPCQAMAIKEKRRCRLHGGAPGSGASPGNQNALKHGYYSRAVMMQRQIERRALAQFLALLQSH